MAHCETEPIVSLPDSELYLANPAEIHYVRSLDRALISLAGHDATVVVGLDVVKVLERCTPPRTLTDHACRIAENLGGDRNSVLALLRNLVEHRLLIADAFASDADEQFAFGDDRVPTLAIVTAERPEMARRALCSYLRGRNPEIGPRRFVISDGSRTVDSARRTRAALESIKPTPDCSVAYVGPDLRERLRKDAMTAGFPREVLHWALPDPPVEFAAGAVRNLSMLVLAGESFLMADDDTFGDLRTAAWCESGGAFIGHGDARQAVWPSNRSETLDLSRPVKADVTLCHGAVLGRDLRALRHRWRLDCNLDQVCKHLTLALQGLKPGRVRATWAGVAGDGAHYCPHWNLFASGTTRDLLASDKEMFHRALSSREVLRSVRRTTVTDEASFMAYCSSLENTQVLPPFSPTGRNEDGLFAVMLRAVHPQAFVAQLPHVVIHDSGRPALFGSPGPMSASRLRLSEIIASLIQRWSGNCAATKIERRLQELGRYFEDLADLEPYDFQALLKQQAVEAKWQLLIKCETTRNSAYPYPDYWQEAFRQYSEVVCHTLNEPGFYLPFEFRDCGPRAVELVQHHFRMLGETLNIWPDLWSFCAAQRHAKGWLEP